MSYFNDMTRPSCGTPAISKEFTALIIIHGGADSDLDKTGGKK